MMAMGVQTKIFCRTVASTFRPENQAAETRRGNAKNRSPAKNGHAASVNELCALISRIQKVTVSNVRVASTTGVAKNMILLIFIPNSNVLNDDLRCYTAVSSILLLCVFLLQLLSQFRGIVRQGSQHQEATERQAKKGERKSGVYRQVSRAIGYGTLDVNNGTEAHDRSPNPRQRSHANIPGLPEGNLLLNIGIFHFIHAQRRA